MEILKTDKNMQKKSFVFLINACDLFALICVY